VDFSCINEVTLLIGHHIVAEADDDDDDDEFCKTRRNRPLSALWR